MKKSTRSCRRILALLFFGMVVGGGAYAQSNQIIDAVLEEENLSYGHAAYLVLVAGERLSETASINEAASELEDLGWGIPGRAVSAAVDFGEYSYFLMESLGLKGGLMYRIAPGPRYATRDVAALGIAEGYALTGMGISGERALRMLGRALAYAEGDRL